MSAAAPRPARLRLGQWFAIAAGGMAAVVLTGFVAGMVALDRLADDRRLTVDRLSPAILSTLRLNTALLSEDTGVRAYALSGDPAFLEPYRRGRAEEPVARREVARLTADAAPHLTRSLQAVETAAAAWRSEYALPVIQAVRAGEFRFDRAQQAKGQRLFDDVRDALRDLQSGLAAERAVARERLREAAGRVEAIFHAFVVALLASVLAAVVILRRVVVRPIARLAEQVRAVVDGDFEHRVQGDGAREVVSLGADVEAMRARILAERDELQRSNAELEQFAYVASHDLQEPLRKVASFTQMLQRRYADQLDERADTYIAYAVDGAKRMQELINDLLAFSRVGRLKEPEVVVDCADLVEHARASLSGAIEETGATLEVGELPRVRGEPSLLALVFQNLLGNGLKFRGEEPPRITVDAVRDGAEWRFTVADNGIGIEPEYADRIFVIFQRLHPRATYEGTGIGLAMCRKVIEYHGGRIWLDTSRGGGATFHFTLPAIDDDHDAQRGDQPTP